MLVNILVEGYLDEVVGTRLLVQCGHTPGVSYGKRGWTYIKQKVAAFDKTCATQGLLTLVDLMDAKEDCPAKVVRGWVPNKSENHVFRLVIREIESWLLADRAGMARFLGVPLAKMPHEPEVLDDPKLSLINLARASKNKIIREGLVPIQGFSSSEGPMYTSLLTDFVMSKWDPAEAILASDSLRRCIERLRQLPV